MSALVGDALPPELVDRIVERSDGNPLFIEELLRTWVSVGTLVRDGSGADAGWRLTVAAAEISLPASVQSIYAAQLDDLPPDARTLARRASVAGRRFPVGALEPLGAAAEAGLGPLQRRELVVGPTSEPIVGDRVLIPSRAPARRRLCEPGAGRAGAAARPPGTLAGGSGGRARARGRGADRRALRRRARERPGAFP